MTPVPVILPIVIVALLSALVTLHSILADAILAVAVIGSEQVQVGDDVGAVNVGVILIAEAVAAESAPLTLNVYTPSLPHVPVPIPDAVNVVLATLGSSSGSSGSSGSSRSSGSLEAGHYL